MLRWGSFDPLKNCREIASSQLGERRSYGVMHAEASPSGKGEIVSGQSLRSSVQRISQEEEAKRGCWWRHLCAEKVLLCNPSMNETDRQRHLRFLRLFAANEAAIHGFVRSLVPRREDAREIMQEVAVVLWEKFDHFDPERDFRKWACGVARFEVLAFRRDRARDRHVFDESLVVTLADESIQDSAGDSRRVALEECLEKLDPPQRQLVLAAYAPGIRIDSLAAERGQTAMSLYKVLHRIRQALLRCVERTLTSEGLS